MKCIGEGKGLVYVASHEPGGRELKEKRGEERESERGEGKNEGGRCIGKGDEGSGSHAAWMLDCHVTIIDVLQLVIFIRLSSWCRP